MKILIASDSFKESLTSIEVGVALKKGLEKVLHHAFIEIIPMADGGEGTVEAIVLATKGKLVNLITHDPLMRKINSTYGITKDGTTAIIEMAATSGLALLTKEERNPLITSTFGVGEMIDDAITKRCKTIVIGIGGSATNDAGVGMALSLGAEIKDKNGKQIGFGGGELAKIEKIDLTLLQNKIKNIIFIAACDVDNPLIGNLGAQYVFAAQKGADLQMIENLELNMIHFSHILKKTFGIDFSTIHGTGAAGGLGAGLMAFLKAELKPGFEVISKITNLEEKIIHSDIVITGEGKIDYQTRFGKTPFGVALLAKKNHKKVIAIAGILGEKWETLSDVFDEIFTISDNSVSKAESIKKAAFFCEKTGERIGKMNIF